MDANAVSDVWYIKYLRKSRESEVRGEKIARVLYEYYFSVLNVPCDEFTFRRPAGQSDVDVSVGNDAWMNFACEWKIMEDWSVSDHNVILIDVLHGPEVSMNELSGNETRWKLKNVD